MLGTSFDDSNSLELAAASTSTTLIPPPTGLWPTVLAKVGHRRQGATTPIGWRLGWVRKLVFASHEGLFKHMFPSVLYSLTITLLRWLCYMLRSQDRPQVQHEKEAEREKEKECDGFSSLQREAALSHQQ
jgi:hypothetical protein